MLRPEPALPPPPLEPRVLHRDGGDRHAVRIARTTSRVMASYPHSRRCPLCGKAPSGGISERIVPASVNYIHRKFGECPRSQRCL